MRIEFITHDDPHYTLPLFEEFLNQYGSEFEITRICCCRAMGNRSRKQLVRSLLALYGPLGFVRLGASVAGARLLSLLPPKPRAARCYSMKQLCRAHGLVYEQIGNPNAADHVRAMAERAPEVLISVACPFILKAPLLSLPPRGAINIHHAPLPRYKGMMPTFWQMFHGEKKVGVTVHYMSAKTDEGAALLQEELAIEPGEALDALIRRSKRHGAHCLARVLKRLADGSQRAVALDQSAGSYFTFPTLEEIREFRRRGYRAL